MVKGLGCLEIQEKGEGSEYDGIWRDRGVGIGNLLVRFLGSLKIEGVGMEDWAYCPMKILEERAGWTKMMMSGDYPIIKIA